MSDCSVSGGAIRHYVERFIAYAKLAERRPQLKQAEKVRKLYGQL